MTDDNKSETQADIARRAMELKAEAAPPPHPDSEPTANEGMTLNDGNSIAPSGAFGAQGDRPVRDRSGHRA